jgi:hypothetical protein
MHRPTSLLLAASLLALATSPAISQSFQPKSIRFIGAPDYSDQEILNTLQLTPGSTLSYAEMNADAQKLVDTGMFSSVSFKFDGQNLIFQITPAAALLPLRLHNLPFPAGRNLDENLHRQFPLYHGLLPEQGGLTEDVRGALQRMLAAQQIRAQVAAVPLNDPVLHKATAVNFSIVSPPVLVGDLTTVGAVIALDPKAAAILAKFPGTLYDAETSLREVEAAFIAYYKDQGYPDPAVHATADTKPVITPTAIRVSLHVSLVPGVQYKLGSVHLAPDLLVSQADFDRQFHFRTGDVADGVRLRDAWKFIEATYHDRGYVKAKVQPAATIDLANKAVSYYVSVYPGPAYAMGKLTIDNVTDDLRAAMLAAWKMPEGSVFDESLISAFFSAHSVNPALNQVFSGADCHYTLQFHDDAHTVDVKLTLEKKP